MYLEQPPSESIIFGCNVFLGAHGLFTCRGAHNTPYFELRAYRKSRGKKGEKDRANRDRMGDPRCYFPNAPFSLVLYLHQILHPVYKIPRPLLSPPRSSFLLMPRILNLAETAAERVGEKLRTWTGRPDNMNDTHSLKWPRSGFGNTTFNANPHTKWPPG